MARIKAPSGATVLAPIARATGTGAPLVALGLVLVTMVGLSATVLKSGSLVEPVGLGLLALLAAAGVFLVFGLLSGFLRLSERAVEADIVKTVTDGLDTGLQIVGRSGTLLYRNHALRRLAGTRSGREATLEELFAGEPQSAQAFYRLNRAADRGEAREEEVYVRPGALDHQGGRWLHVSVQPFAAPSGRGQDAPLTLWQVRDVTRERTRELETVTSLRAMLSLYDDLPQGLLAVAADGRIAHINTTLAQWLALRPEAGRSLTLADVVPPDGAALIRAAGRSGRITRLDLDLLRDDGRALPVHLICRGHGARGVLSILVLDRGESQQERARAPGEVQLERTVHAAPFGIAIAGTDGRILDANAAFMRMFLRDDGAPETVEDLAPDSDERTSGELTRALQRAYSGRTGASPVEVFLGAQREFARRIYVSPLGAGARSREGAILYAIDATEQKELELKFAHSHKMEAVGQLAGGVAHDFNNVLTAIIGFSDLLLQTHRPTDPAYRDIMNIKSSANRAAGLVRQLLAYSRRQTLQAEVLELGELLTDLSALLNKALGEKIALKILPGRDLWHVKADKTQFEHVIINLAVNAKDAMPDGGRLTVRLRNVSERESLKLTGLGVAAGEYLLVEVEDTGVGIPPDVIGRIFEPFFTTKDVGKGTGLGLSTVYGIVKQTGGYIFADSEVGTGTTFRIYLPRHIVESEDELPQRARKAEVTRDLTGAGRVLLVEDEDVVRSFAARALSRQGYEVLEAGTGVEALELMQREQRRIDLVVSDVIMPEMDGPTLLKELRKSKPDLKFIFVSGYPDDAFKKSLDDGEDYAFLPKPFTLPQLAAKVKEQLGR
ncbi:MAG TPA: ATP-binding protein [Hyphomicrobiaceae bacterium]|jgi:two-component system cell cycle sensor histidine kinase/response regulator CckA|nr:ATP-binding protein [Hyphomicrobiaceae bacterium]